MVKRIEISDEVKPFDGSFYDEQYYENGQGSGKGWLMNYRWMPRRTLKEAFALIDYMGLDESSYVLDVGCAKGYIVKALRILEIKADGCDISKYALSFAPEGCWDCSVPGAWEEHYTSGYTHIVIKDMLEHLTMPQLSELLDHCKKTARKLICVIPMGDNGIYRIPEYHMEVSHLIAEDEFWWARQFHANGWIVEKSCPHVYGLKDNWQSHAEGFGNHVFLISNNHDSH
jgi:SAM-dependent methyltransferase